MHKVTTIRMQKDLFTLTDKEQAKAIQDTNFLCYFLKPSSASDVAKELNIAASLAHHHCNKYLRLSILFEAKREGKKILYQLSATNYRYKHDLLPIEDSSHHVLKKLNHMSESYLTAYERTENLIPQDHYEWHTVGFQTKDDSLQTSGIDIDEVMAIEDFPPHFESRSFKVDSKNYVEMIRKISSIICEHEITNDTKGKACTLSFLAFQDRKISPKQDSHSISSYAIKVPNES